jgi:hypothetical protein
MVEVTAQDIKNYAQEMQSEGNQRIEMFIEFGRLFVSETKFGAKSKLGIILITCHLITMANRDGTGGAVTSERVGELARSYGQASGNSNQELASTAYGQQFLMLRKTLVITPLVV